MIPEAEDVEAVLGRVLDPVGDEGRPWGYGWRGGESSLPGVEGVGGTTPAAVLVPVIREARVSLLLTERTMTVKDHKGQVSFPGGAVEAGESYIETALRETEEEIGVARELVRVVGRLRPYDTITGYRIHPFVGVIDGRPAVRPSDEEIAQVFFVEMGRLMDEAVFQQTRVEWEGVEYEVKAYDWGGPVIWGATANILSELFGRLRS